MKKNHLIVASVASALALALWVVASLEGAGPKAGPTPGPSVEDELRLSTSTANGSGSAAGDSSRVSAAEEAGPVASAELSKLEALRAAKFAEFGKYSKYAREIPAYMLSDPGFSREQDSILSAMRKWVIKTELTSEDIRSEIERLKAEGGHFEVLILAMPYSKGASADDLELVQQLARSGSETATLAAIHALTTFQFYVPDAGETPLWDVANFNLAQLEADGPGPATLQKAQLALDLMAHIEGPEQAAQIKSLLETPDLPDDLRGSALELLARAGGAAGAQRALTALALDDPSALGAVRAIRDPSAAIELTSLAGQPLADAKATKTAAAAFSGLFGAKPEAALELLETSILPRLQQAEGEEKERLTDLITQTLEGISDKRDAGPAKLLSQALYEGDPAKLRDLPKPWQDAVDNLSSRVLPNAFNLPAGPLQDEICERFRWALDRLPSDSRGYQDGLYQLTRFGRPEDLQYIAEHAYLLDNDIGVTKSLARRHEDDLNGTVSLSR